MADFIPIPYLPAGHILLMIYSWVSMSLYAILLIVLVKRGRKFKGPFYTMVYYNSIADFLMFFYYELLHRPRRYRFFNIFKADDAMWSAQTLLFINMAFRNAMVLGYPMFAINRFTAFVAPVNHSRIWSDSLIRNANILIWLFCFLTAIPVYFYPQVYSIEPTGILQVIGNDVGMYRNVVNVIISVLVVILCLCLYSAASYYASQPQNQQYFTTGTNSLERKLLVCSILTFIPTLVELVRYGFDYYGQYTNNLGVKLVTSEASFYITEISTSIQCWTLLLVSKSLRKSFIHMFCKQRRTSERNTNTITGYLPQSDDQRKQA